MIMRNVVDWLWLYKHEYKLRYKSVVTIDFLKLEVQICHLHVKIHRGD